MRRACVVDQWQILVCLVRSFLVSDADVHTTDFSSLHSSFFTGGLVWRGPVAVMHPVPHRILRACIGRSDPIVPVMQQMLFKMDMYVFTANLRQNTKRYRFSDYRRIICTLGIFWDYFLGLFLGLLGLFCGLF